MPRNLQQGGQRHTGNVPIIPGHDPDFPDIDLLVASTIDLTEDVPPSKTFPLGLVYTSSESYD